MQLTEWKASSSQAEVVGDLEDDLREAEEELAQLELLVVLEGDGRRPPGLGDGLGREVGLPRDGADPRVGVQHVDRRVALEGRHDLKGVPSLPSRSSHTFMNVVMIL